MPVLMIPKAPGVEEYHQLDRLSVSIGRDPGCDIVLAHVSVSRRHAAITTEGERFFLEDLRSKNGTLVNGRTVVRVELRGGERIHFGDVPATFVRDDRTLKELPDARFDETFSLRREDLPEAVPAHRFVYELAEVAATRDNEGEAVAAGLDIVRRQLNAENVYLGLLDPRTGRETRSFYSRQHEDSRPFRLSRTILNRAIATLTACLIQDARRDETLKDQASVLDTGTRSALCAPIIVAGKLEGVLYADTRSRVRPFVRDDLALAGALGTLLGAILRNLQTVRDLKEWNKELQKRLEGVDLIGEHPQLEATRRTIQNFALRGDAPVLVYGESGSGKELAARLLHRLSNRAAGPFLAVNCAAVPRDMIESELFGHVKGAFTSAVSARRGLFELARGGSLFLDEIGEMPLDQQGKLLRVLESGEFRPIGSEATHHADVRVIAATNRKLEQMAAQGLFRKDLYYRLKVLYVEMPPLREVATDIPALAEFFLANLRQSVSTRAVGFSPAAREQLQTHLWPGNVRELKNAIERALYCCDVEEIGPEHLFGAGAAAAASAQEDAAAHDTTLITLGEQLENLERAQIEAALARHGWNKTKAAEELNIARKTLIAKVKRHRLKPRST